MKFTGNISQKCVIVMVENVYEHKFTIFYYDLLNVVGAVLLKIHIS